MSKFRNESFLLPLKKVKVYRRREISSNKQWISFKSHKSTEKVKAYEWSVRRYLILNRVIRNMMLSFKKCR